SGIIVIDPPRAATRGACESPRIFQVRVGDRRHSWQIRHEVRLFVVLSLRDCGEQERRKNKQYKKLAGHHDRICLQSVIFRSKTNPMWLLNESLRFAGLDLFWCRRATKQCQKNVKGLSGSHFLRIDKTGLASSPLKEWLQSYGILDSIDKKY